MKKLKPICIKSFLLLGLLSFNFINAQTTGSEEAQTINPKEERLGQYKVLVDVETNMSIDFSFGEQVLINRLKKTQDDLVAKGELTDKESYCTTVNTLAVLKDDAGKFVELAEKNDNNIELTLLEKEEADRISRKYFDRFILVANRCSELYGVQISDNALENPSQDHIDRSDNITQ